ncbi:MAG: DUF3047 domain-containing protein [Candidatus Binatia bacterium]
MPEGWELRTKPGTKATKFTVDPDAADGTGALVIESENASGTFATQLKSVNLARTPILRWRWRVLDFPRDGDGRVPERDDQAIAIYVSSGGRLNQRSVAYRWETKTPVGEEGDASYVGGIVKVHWIVLRNEDDGSGVFYLEKRNVAEDFQRAFGFVPDKPIIAVSANTQYTNSYSLAELDWIEITSAPEAPKQR